MAKHRNRTPPIIGTMELRCDCCGTRSKVDAADAADAAPACPECHAAMVPMQAHVVQRHGRKR